MRIERTRSFVLEQRRNYVAGATIRSLSSAANACGGEAFQFH
jgi:hypothetical protein